jgi:hypothetical protein
VAVVVFAGASARDDSDDGAGLLADGRPARVALADRLADLELLRPEGGAARRDPLALREDPDARLAEAGADGDVLVVLAVPDREHRLAGLRGGLKAHGEGLDAGDGLVEHHQGDVRVAEVAALGSDDRAGHGVGALREARRRADVDPHGAGILVVVDVLAVRRSPGLVARHRGRHVLGHAVAGGEDDVGSDQGTRAELEGAAGAHAERDDRVERLAAVLLAAENRGAGAEVDRQKDRLVPIQALLGRAAPEGDRDHGEGSGDPVELARTTQARTRLGGRKCGNTGRKGRSHWDCRTPSS